ncbi:hypothetical protein ACSSS7_001528 [Eimeria intestinalis]
MLTAGDPTVRWSFLWYREPIDRSEAEKYLKVQQKRNDFRDKTRAQLYHVLEQMPPHEHVMKLKSWKDCNNHFRVELELIKGPCLHDCLVHSESLDPQIARYILQQLLIGLHHLHSHGVVHCDIKPHNVMLRCIGPGSPTRATSFYLCPGVAKGGRHSVAEDIWQLGAVFYRLLTSQYVQRTQFGFFNIPTARIMRNTLEDRDVDYALPVFEKCPDARRICIWMLRVEPNDRPRSCAEVLLDPWIINPAIKRYLADHPPREPMRYPCLMTEEEEERIRFKSAKASTKSGGSPPPETNVTLQPLHTLLEQDAFVARGPL